MGEALGAAEEDRRLWQGDACLLAGRGRKAVGWEEEPLASRGENGPAVAFFGELYNARDLACALEGAGGGLLGGPAAQVVLSALERWGEGALERLEGPFALAYWDGERLLCARDRLGEIPLFYAWREGVFLFSTAPAPLFAYWGENGALSREGLCQLLGVGPARVPGRGLFQGVEELPPACRLLLSRSGGQTAPYWRLEARPHGEGPEETAERVRELAARGVSQCMAGEGALTALLSGGVGSSMVAALAAQARMERGQPPLETLSFRPPQRGNRQTRAETIAGVFHTSHQEQEWDAPALAAALEEAGLADGLPGLGGADAAWLWVGRSAQPGRLLSGGWGRVVFEDLPWSRWEERGSAPGLPWCPDLGVRRQLFRREVWEALGVERWLAQACADSLARCPVLEGEPPWERRRREASWLTLTWWFSPTLAGEGRMARRAGVSLRRPLCRPDLLAYAWNIPHGMKNLNGRGRELFRSAARPLLPACPPLPARRPGQGEDGALYGQLVGARLARILEDPSAPLLRLVRPDALGRMLLEGRERPWGWPGLGAQRVQLMGWLVQLNALLERYPAGL